MKNMSHMQGNSSLLYSAHKYRVALNIIIVFFEVETVGKLIRAAPLT